MKKPEKDAIRVICTNRKATHDFFLHERFEAGLALVGSEVKSLREAAVTMADGWVEIRKGQAFLHGIQINEYAQANRWQHEVGRVRKILMHRHEIDKIATKVLIKGFTLIPLQLYFKGGLVKVELALVTQKKHHDKRAVKREADDKRDMNREMKKHRR
ncbi:MAG: SsrA-binding protein SmpB [Proteobacteria bacterium]|nr:SsrA-binding protein SmpB [Pseudomonadota bacterium]